jgi:hypothetical protein
VNSCYATFARIALNERAVYSFVCLSEHLISELLYGFESSLVGDLRLRLLEQFDFGLY